MEPRKINSRLRIWKEKDPKNLKPTPSAPEDPYKTPINFSIRYLIEIEGLLSREEESTRNWILKISVSMIGALTHGLNLTPHLIMHLGMELEKYITPKAIHLEATSFGTGPRLRAQGEYKAFTCFASACTPNNYLRKMSEYSILSGLNDTHAFFLS